MNQTVAIFGATGAQGAPVVREALASELNVRAVARDTAKIAKMHPNAQSFAAGLSDEEAIVRALDGVDAAFLHLPAPQGPDDGPLWLKTFLTSAHRASLSLLVYTTGATSGPRYPSSMMVDAATGGMQAVLDSGIPSIVLQPTIYLENLLPDWFVPRLRTEGVLDYPPLPAGFAVQWTSHIDQARIAVAALMRPDLAGNSYEIGSPQAVTGPDLAKLLSNWIDRPVRYEAMRPAEFGDRFGRDMNNPGIGVALAELYGSFDTMGNNDMIIDTNRLEDIFGITLTSIDDHISGWTKK